MKKFWSRGFSPMILVVLFVILIVPQNINAQSVYDGPGPWALWSGDTLKKDSTKTSVSLHTGHFAQFGIWLKSTNPADSTNYRVSFKGAFLASDVFAIASDTLGAESYATIMRVSDTLWHYCSVQPPCATYTKIFLTALPGHGNRCRVWFKTFLWRSGYWEDYKPIE